ncbi:hypothetical protein [Paenibacillus gallinarum]|nr:hypothetical protein [Paenibacillus gallinarum]
MMMKQRGIMMLFFLHELLDGSKATRSGHDAAMPSLISHQSALGP